MAKFRQLSLVFGLGFLWPYLVFAGDSTSLRHWLLDGSRWTLYHRQFAMATWNQGPLKDDAAYAAGGGLRYQSPCWGGWDIFFNGSFHQVLARSDYYRPDGLTGVANRYELPLGDVENPQAKQFARVEEMHLRYQKQNLERRILLFQLGRFVVNTPWINTQDGRMNPNVQSGLRLAWQPNKVWTLGFWGFWATSPRSTYRFMSLAESMGKYPQGRQVEGHAGAYAGAVQTEGLGLTHLAYEPKPWLGLSLHHYHLWRVFSLLHFEIASKPEKRGWLYGLMLLRQDGLPQRATPWERRYLPAGAKAQALSLRLGWSWRSWTLHGNYTRIDASGRLVFPREWGRDPFYTFLPRERNEGTGDVHAWALQALYKRGDWAMHTGYGWYRLPAPELSAYNKYGLPSYGHLYTRWEWQPNRGFWQGINLALVYVYKHALEQPSDLRWVQNRVNLHHVNLILNYSIGGSLPKTSE